MGEWLRVISCETLINQSVINIRNHQGDGEFKIVGQGWKKNDISISAWEALVVGSPSLPYPAPRRGQGMSGRIIKICGELKKGLWQEGMPPCPTFKVPIDESKYEKSTGWVDRNWATGYRVTGYMACSWDRLEAVVRVNDQIASEPVPPIKDTKARKYRNSDKTDFRLFQGTCYTSFQLEDPRTASHPRWIRAVGRGTFLLSCLFKSCELRI